MQPPQINFEFLLKGGLHQPVFVPAQQTANCWLCQRESSRLSLLGMPAFRSRREVGRLVSACRHAKKGREMRDKAAHGLTFRTGSSRGRTRRKDAGLEAGQHSCLNGVRRSEYMDMETEHTDSTTKGGKSKSCLGPLPSQAGMGRGYGTAVR